MAASSNQHEDIICLKTDTGIQYVGTVCNVNHCRRTISLRNVRCYGIEDRVTGILFEPRNFISELLTFPLKNIKFFNVVDSLKPPPALSTDEEVFQSYSIPLNCLGTVISLITNSGVRYIGTICRVNNEKHIISLRDVKCYGIEDKATGVLCEPRDNFFIFLSFPVGDIKSFNVEKRVMPPPELPSEEEAIKSRTISLKRGTVICLKTKAGFRYIGTICDVNRASHTISLSDVRPCGFEDTSTGMLCEPQDKVFEYLNFTLNDIKSFNVMKQPTPSSALLAYQSDTNSETRIHRSYDENPIVDVCAPKSRISTEKSQDSTAYSKEQISSRVQISETNDGRELRKSMQKKYIYIPCSNTASEPLDTENSASNEVPDQYGISSTEQGDSVHHCSDQISSGIQTLKMYHENDPVKDMQDVSSASGEAPDQCGISSTEQSDCVHHSNDQISSRMQTLKMYHENDPVKDMQDVSSACGEVSDQCGISSTEQNDSDNHWNDQISSRMQTLQMYHVNDLAKEMQDVCKNISYSHTTTGAFDAGPEASVITTAEEWHSIPRLSDKIIVTMRIKETHYVRHLQMVTQDENVLISCSYTAVQPFYGDNFAFGISRRAFIKQMLKFNNRKSVNSRKVANSITEEGDSAPHFNDQMFSKMQILKINDVSDSRKAIQDEDKPISTSDLFIKPLYKGSSTTEEVPELCGIS